jgi:hypothetical protein
VQEKKSPLKGIDKYAQTRYKNKAFFVRNALCDISATPNLAEIDQGACHIRGNYEQSCICH